MTTAAQKPLRVFCSYSRKDEGYLNDLRDWLHDLERQGLIEWWHDREIVPGREYEKDIDKHLRNADIILLLVSPTFMASDYVYAKEVSVAVDRHERDEVRVIPIIVRRTRWERAPFAKLQALPKDAKPVTAWIDKDEAWFSVAEGVEKAVEELLVERQEQAAKERYRKAVEEAWADKKLSDAEAQRLGALASELGISVDTSTYIEREAMSGTAEETIERQEREDREKRLEGLYARARELYGNRRWQEVEEVFDRIRSEDATYPDPERLLSLAREALKTEQEQERRETVKHTPERTRKPTKQAPLRARLKSTCDKYVEDLGNRFNVWPNIPSAKEQAARSSFVPATEPVLIALYDHTLLKRSKGGFAVGSLGLYERDWPKGPKQLSWEQLASASHILLMGKYNGVVIETSGVPPNDHESVALYIHTWDAHGKEALGELVYDLHSLLNPSGPTASFPM
jgi:TIR domain